MRNPDLFDKLVCPLYMNLAWRSDVSLQKLISLTSLQIDFRYKIDPLDLWETIFARIPDAQDGTDLRLSA